MRKGGTSSPLFRAAPVCILTRRGPPANLACRHGALAFSYDEPTTRGSMKGDGAELFATLSRVVKDAVGSTTGIKSSLSSYSNADADASEFAIGVADGNEIILVSHSADSIAK